ncbi:hypothetical protein ACFZC3_15410 [Streptomyces sp. NPDC007903]|uniref:hypothetical protein n=1 Tax=Streptomyces sp. NPDC007903 TaxID=3364786 RepID=UPI0036E5B7A6
MSDNESSQHEDAQPEEPEPNTGSEPAGTGSHLPQLPAVPPIDLSRLIGVQDTVRGIREQLTRHIASVGSIRDRLDDMMPTVSAMPPAFDVSGVVEQVRQAAFLGSSLPGYDFAPDLGRMLNAGRQTWMASFRVAVEAARRFIPENLRDLSFGELRKVFQINEEDGTSLAWAPRASIVAELMQAPDMAARSTLLVAHAAEISSDLDTSLGSVVLPEHRDLRAMLLQATEALRAGLWVPAQAAASAVLDPVVNVRMLEFLAYTGRGSRDQTRAHFRPIEAAAWKEATFAEAGLVLVGAGISTAFGYWKRGKGLASFSRNGSAHHADDGAYSPAHAVRAVLIAHAALRWLDEAVVEARGEEDAA